MGKIKTKIEEVPLKSFLLLILILSIFFILLFFAIVGTVYVSFRSQAQMFFNSTNMTTVTSFFYSPSSANPINFDALIAMVTLLGAFGVFCYIFFSINDGSFSDKTENKSFLYGFWGLISIILLLDISLILSLLMDNWQSPKLWELMILLLFFIITLIVAYFFSQVYDSIEENYENRNSIINFLKRVDDKKIISPNLDFLSREIIRYNSLFVMYIFFTIIAISFFGIIVGFNFLTTISIILMSLAIFSGYSRLILLCEPNSNIELIKQNPPFYLSSSWIYSSPKCLSNVFTLRESTDYLTVLTKKGNDSAKITISKYCVFSIHDNDYQIFEEKKFDIF